MRVREVILKAMKGEYTWIQAAEILGLSPRTLRRWRTKFQNYGFDGLLDRRRVEHSPRAVTEAEAQRWFRLYRQRYRGYNARHFYAALKRRPPVAGPTAWCCGRCRAPDWSASTGRGGVTSCAVHRAPASASCSTSTAACTAGYAAAPSSARA
jgi:hypothetical protein